MVRVFSGNLFTESISSGVFELHNPEVLQVVKSTAIEHDYFYVELDGMKITTREECISSFNVGLKFPTDLRDSWDALESELRSMDWIPNKGVVIVYRDFHVFQESDLKEFKILLSIIHDNIQLKRHRIRLNSQELYFVFYSESDVWLPPVEIKTPMLVNFR